MATFGRYPDNPLPFLTHTHIALQSDRMDRLETLLGMLGGASLLLHGESRGMSQK
jgi:hypothetical protein